MSNTVFILDQISKSYKQAAGVLDIIHPSSLTLSRGEIVALVGPSGSGKSTLLQIAGLLDTPDSGTITINGIACSRLNDTERTRVRREQLGFVYQFHHLLPEFSALENVAIPLMIRGIARKDADAKAQDMLERLGLGHRLKHRPATLSGGEQQRVAIARALVGNPAILLADEPTGNLDPHTSADVFSLLVETVKAQNLAALIVTHNDHLASKMDRRVTIQEGVVVEA